MDVGAWRGLELLDRLLGGARGEVYGARRGRERFVVRRSIRSAAALAWELDLVEHLAAHGLAVPVHVPTDDGRAHDDGVLVQRFLPGRPPASTADWRRVADALTQVHELTPGWPQRSGFAAAADLLTTTRGGDVDLTAMPSGAVVLVRAAWAPVVDGPRCAVHGDAGGGNVLVHEGRVALLDWDEARVDVPAFDFGHLPLDTPPAVRRAGVAWEAATCWVAEPEYAARRLAELADQDDQHA